ncbi:MAG: hypothetical protein ACTSYD_03255 [Candidatus Heimdallarchaeaceae archaeon]
MYELEKYKSFQVMQEERREEKVEKNERISRRLCLFFLFYKVSTKKEKITITKASKKFILI